MSIRPILRLGQQLKRWPALYHLVEQIYYSLKPAQLSYLILGTKMREREWAKRHLAKGNDWNNTQHIGKKDEWVLSYWDSRNHSHRPLLIEKIAAFYPFSSVLEIGCNCGPNLYLIAKRFPDIEIKGIDVNVRAIEKGNEFFTVEGISNVMLAVGKADELEQFKYKSFDIVFTDAVLIYVGRDKIKAIIQDMLRVSRKALILVEWHSSESTPEGSMFDVVHYPGQWIRDYVSLLKQFVPEQQIHVTKIPEDKWPGVWKEVGYVIEVIV